MIALLQTRRIHIRRRAGATLDIVPHHDRRNRVAALLDVPIVQHGRRVTQTQRSVHRDVTAPQRRCCEGFVEVVGVPLAEELIIEDRRLVDQSVESFLGVFGWGGRRGLDEIQVEDGGFYARAGDGVGEDELSDLGDEFVRVGG